jgi:transforming growth factor-beta-induced protein
MNEKFDVIETATQSGNFRVFLQALETAGLKQSLKDAGPYTVFAPIDDAFVKMPASKCETLFKPENRELLQSLLRHHIVLGKVPSRELKRLDQIQAAGGQELTIESRAGLWINEAQVLTTDLMASNGVLHGIDAVLMPETRAAATS